MAHAFAAVKPLETHAEPTGHDVLVFVSGQKYPLGHGTSAAPPPAQNDPTAQAFAAVKPSETQVEPAGHGVLVNVLGQKYPLGHSASMAVPIGQKLPTPQSNPAMSYVAIGHA